MADSNPLIMIVSGGQTGVDRAALDVAIKLGIPHGGWCPKGRRSEDGRIPIRYRLKETQERDYSVRTEQNVVDSVGTLILFRGEIKGGTHLTLKLAQKHDRPYLCIDLDEFESSLGLFPAQIVNWLIDHEVVVLNIAGPRASSSDGIQRKALSFLERALVQG